MTKPILNLTQHPATPEQKEAGVVDVPEYMQPELHSLLTFRHLPDCNELERRADFIMLLAKTVAERHYDNQIEGVMIGGAPYMMRPLEDAAYSFDLPVFYSFSERISHEETQPDGSVRKVSTYRHQGWVTA